MCIYQENTIMRNFYIFLLVEGAGCMGGEIKGLDLLDLRIGHLDEMSHVKLVKLDGCRS